MSNISSLLTHQHRHFAGSILGTALAAALLLNPAFSNASEAFGSAPQTGAQASPSGGQPPNFAAIVQRYGQAVVHIDAYRGRPSEGGTASSLGSGFIVSRDGFVLTNHHVVANADYATVKLADGRTLAARVVGTDRAADVAVLKIAASDLPTVAIGDPAQSRVGEWVVAIGSPYGLDNTVTSGIISAKSRQMSETSPVRFIQTDVPLNPGNSGGPLFNLKGEVIGINSMIYSRTGGYQGLSFAIPIDEAMRIKARIVRAGAVQEAGPDGPTVRTSKPRLGVAVRPLSEDEAERLGVDAGVLVQNATGPAALAGVHPGDVILGVNGVVVEDIDQLRRMIDASRGTVSIAIVRRGQTATVRVQLADAATEG
ncbi:S1C family serine protease [Pandoraea sputorum]|uniref:S1C family serine protease n=1 Tax=Pandoraea sputorum TaxID=93222 RepID=UPI0012425379|nr:peptidase [Pandoraea sputorum]